MIPAEVHVCVFIGGGAFRSQRIQNHGMSRPRAQAGPPWRTGRHSHHGFRDRHPGCAVRPTRLYALILDTSWAGCLSRGQRGSGSGWNSLQGGQLSPGNNVVTRQGGQSRRHSAPKSRVLALCSQSSGETALCTKHCKGYGGGQRGCHGGTCGRGRR